jgi:hypothetical protein
MTENVIQKHSCPLMTRIPDELNWRFFLDYLAFVREVIGSTASWARPRYRFFGQHHFRLHAQCTAHGNALLLSTGTLGEILVYVFG